MDRKNIDNGTLVVLMERLETIRLPRARQLLEKVNEGETLSHEDVSFLRRVYDDNRTVQGLLARHPEFRHVMGVMMNLYLEIVTKGLENEKAAGKPGPVATSN